MHTLTGAHRAEGLLEVGVETIEQTRQKGSSFLKKSPGQRCHGAFVLIRGITSQSRIRSTAPLPRGASGEEVRLSDMPRPPLDRSNNDDRRQWRKQGVAVGAAASRRWEPQPGQWQRVSADGEVYFTAEACQMSRA